MKKYEFTVDGEVYEMSMEELAENIARDFAKEILTEEEYKTFCEKQEAIWERNRKKMEEYAYTHYIYDELRDAY